MTRPIPGPAFQWAPPRALTHGDIAVGVAQDLGWDMDPEQRWLLDAIYAEDEDGLPASGEVAIIGPRQTVGKTAVLASAAITDITVFDVPLHVWTAHEFKTARKAYLDMRSRLDSHPDYRDRVTYRDAHGEEAIFFENAGAIEFHARSGGSGRGFTTSRITLDEGLYVRPGDLGALAPTLVTMPDAQVRWASSAGKAPSAVLREIRDRGRNPDLDETLAYLEFAAQRKPCADPECAHKIGTEGCALDDQDLWWQANSGLWYGRVGFEAMAKQRRMLSGAPEEWLREFFSWWDEPAEVAERAISADVYEASQDPESTSLDPIALGIEVSPARQTSLVAAGWREDGRIHGEVVITGQGTAWLLDVLLRVVDQVNPAVLVIDKAGPAGSLLPDIEAAGLEPMVLNAAQRAAADQGLVDDLEQDKVRIVSCPPFDAAAEAVTWKELANARAFDRRHASSDITSIVGLSLARLGLLTAARPRRGPVPAPEPIRSGDAPTGRAVDLMSAGF